MATHRAIAATSRAILGLIDNATSRTDFPGIRFELYHPRDFEKPLNPGVSLFLFRVTPSTSRRNLPPRTAPDGRRYRPSLPIDLYYLLTPWADDVEMQQLLLGHCLRVLEDTPIVPASVLNQYTSDPATFAPSETVELVHDPLNVQDFGVIWDKLRLELETSVTYVARVVLIDSAIEHNGGAAVQTRVFDTGRVAVP